MNNNIINYRGATTTANDVKAGNLSHANSLQNNNPELSYRGASVKYSEIHG